MDASSITSKAKQASVISRRTFTAGAAAAIGSMLLEPVFGKQHTFLMPGVSQAYADQPKLTVSVDTGKFCVVVYDAESGSSATVPNAKVVVTSLYKSAKTAEACATTDSKGCAFFDVKSMGKQQTSTQIGDIWEFDAKITVTADGMRDTVVSCVHIMDGIAVAAPTRKLDGKPYFRTMSFNDWDIQYNDAEFVVAGTNDISHKLAVELYFPDAATYSIQPVITKSDTASRVGTAIADAQTLQGSKGDFKTVTFEDTWLNASSPKVLRPGDVVSLVINDPSKSGDAARLYSIKTGLATFLTPVSDGWTKDEGYLSPIAAAYRQNQPAAASDDDISLQSAASGLVKPNDLPVTLPGGLPGFLGKALFNVWMPSVPIVFKYDPAATEIVFGIDLEILNYSNQPDPLAPDQTGWRSQPRDNIATQYKRKVASIKNAIEKTSKSYKDYFANGKKMTSSTSSEVSFNMSFQVLADLLYSQSDKKWTGDLNLMLGASLSGSKTWQKFIWFIPYYFDIGLSCQVSLALGLGMLVNCSDQANYNWDSNSWGSWAVTLVTIFQKMEFTNSKTITLAINPKITAGFAVGVAKVAGAGLRCNGGMTFAWQWRKVDGASNPKDPRFLISANVELLFELQVLFFKKSWSLARGNWPNFYDSDTKSNARAIDLDDEEDYYMEDFPEEYSEFKLGGAYYLPENDIMLASDDVVSADEFTIVTEAELAAVAEITATSTGAAVALVDFDDDQVSEPFRINDFTACGTTLGAEDISAATMEGYGSDGIMLTADEAANSYTYNWTEGHEYKYNDRGTGDSIIYKLGDDSGVYPRHMNLLAKDVFSAPNSKLIEINAARYLFRISPVTFDGVTCGRVVYQKITDEGVSQPYPVQYIDKTTADAAKRLQMHDYSFEAKIVYKYQENSEVLLMVLSGKRENGDKTTIAEAAQATVLTALRLTPNNVEGQPAFTTRTCKTWESPDSATSQKAAFAFRNPQLHVYGDNKDEGFERLSNIDGCEHALGYFLVDSADSLGDLFNQEKNQTGIGVVHFSLSGDGDDMIEVACLQSAESIVGFVPDTVLNCPNVGDEQSVYSVLGYVTSTGAGVKSLKLGFEKSSDHCVINSAKVIDVIAEDAKVKKLNSWEEDNQFIAAVSTQADLAADAAVGYLALATIPGASDIAAHENDGKAFASFNLSCISPQNVPLGSTHMRPGHKYFYYSSNHGGVAGYDVDDDGNATMRKEDASYQIMALAQVDGVFTDSFVFAECDNPIDVFYVVEDTNVKSGEHASASFVTCEVTLLESSKSDLYSFDVPFLRCIEAHDITPVGSEVDAGESNDFTITLSNKGNTILTQVDLEFYEYVDGKPADEPFDKMTLNFKDATNASSSGLDEGAYDTSIMSDKSKSNMLVADNGNAAMVPGQVRSFLVSLNIPEGWSGTKQILVKAPSNATYFVDPDTGKVVSEATSVAYYQDDDNNTSIVDLVIAGASDEDPDQGELPGDMIPYGDDDDDDQGGQGGGSGSGDGSGSGSGANGGSNAAMAATGDGVGVLTGATAIAAAAGAGFAAYSARRTKLEREAAEGTTESPIS